MLRLLVVGAAVVSGCASDGKPTGERGGPTSASDIASAPATDAASSSFTTPCAVPTELVCSVPVAPAGAELRLDKTSVTVGEPVTFIGSGCGPDRLVVVVLGPLSGNSSTSAEATPNADGSWLVTTNVSDSTALGSGYAGGACVRTSDKQIVFEYRFLPVHVATFRRLEIAPADAAPQGTTITVTEVGGCPGHGPPPIVAEVELVPSPGSDRDVSAASVAVDVAPDGTWSASLPIPSDARAGSYLVGATCVESRQLLAFYPDVAFTTTAHN